MLRRLYVNRAGIAGEGTTTSPSSILFATKKASLGGGEFASQVVEFEVPGGQCAGLSGECAGLGGESAGLGGECVVLGGECASLGGECMCRSRW